MIRKISIKDKENWKKLYKGYANFYKSPINDIILDTVWSWLMDKNHEVKGIVYEIDGNLTALAHYRAMPRPLKGKYILSYKDLALILSWRVIHLTKSHFSDLDMTLISFINFWPIF